MKTYSTATLSILLLTACNTLSTVNDSTLGLEFSHPIAWGEWREASPTLPDKEVTQERTFSSFGGAEPREVRIIFRRYDTDAYRYEEVCDEEQSVDLCDVTKIQDLLEEKSAFESSATNRIGDVPATMRDWYDVSSGYVIREARFYTPTHRVQILAMYSILDYLISQQQEGESDLYSTMRRMHGEDLDDPILKLLASDPDAFVELKKFFADVDRFLGSITIHAAW